jgi:hypothetical protein
MHRGWIAAVCLCLALGWSSPLLAAQSAPVILALGNTAFLNPMAIQTSTGAEVKTDLDRFVMKDLAVIVLANVAYASLPDLLQQGLVEYVTEGGALLLTGGAQSFGSGGYQAVAPILPFEIRSASDWRSTPFRPPVTLQPGHPILAGVEFITVGAVNDMNPRPGAAEILQAAGGGSAAGRSTGIGGGSYQYPLIAEMGVGAGRVIGIAFDLNEFSGMRDLGQFVQNTLTYLLGVSRLGLNR